MSNCLNQKIDVSIMSFQVTPFCIPIFKKFAQQEGQRWTTRRHAVSYKKKQIKQSCLFRLRLLLHNAEKIFTETNAKMNNYSPKRRHFWPFTLDAHSLMTSENASPGKDRKTWHPQADRTAEKFSREKDCSFLLGFTKCSIYSIYWKIGTQTKFIDCFSNISPW